MLYRLRDDYVPGSGVELSDDVRERIGAALAGAVLG
jgi:hypothetical protein